MICEVNGTERNLPDFLVVGAAKSGTTSIHAYLARHPDVVMPASKETLFFHIVSNPNRAQLRFVPTAVTEFETYLEQFDGATPGQVCGEACPSYLYFHDHTIANLKRFHPRWRDVRIVIVLREPVDKIASHYFFVKNRLGLTAPELSSESIEESLRLEPSRMGNPDVLLDLFYVDGTHYARQIAPYLDSFPHVKTLLYDDLKSRPEAFFQELCDYLGIRFNLNCEVNDRHNAGVRQQQPRGRVGQLIATLARSSATKPVRMVLPQRFKAWMWSSAMVEEAISPETRRVLREEFRDEVRELEQLLRIDLRRWGY